MNSISVTDLKNHLSSRMKRVRAGESLLVTDRKKPVAVLSPLSEMGPEDWITALVVDGWVKIHSRPLDVKKFLSRPRAKCGDGLTGVVLEEREGR